MCLRVVARHRVQRDSAVRDPVFPRDDGQRHVAHRAGEDGGKREQPDHPHRLLHGGMIARCV